MAAILPSRFAVLKVEGEEPDDPKPTKKSVPVKSCPAGDRNSVTAKPKTKKKKKPSESQAKAKANPQASEPKPGTDDWESWKKRDDQFVSDAYEQDLQQALLLSRLDYEEKKDFYEAQQRTVTVAAVAASSNRGAAAKNKKKNGAAKKDKKTTMSLEEFNQRGTSPLTDSIEPEDGGEDP